mmetsp:Transcript_21612/g.28755  ORF Transcript_21612/g.28755 Transcript_21612/m.28755 type:complete len:396 (-) Transcript_21612:166-1353(-)
MNIGSIICAFFALAFAIKLYGVLDFLDYFEEIYSYHDEECIKIMSIGASEDHNKFNDNSIIMTQWKVTDYVPGEDRPGAMYVASGFLNSKKNQSTEEFVAKDLKIKELPIVNYPENVDFHPHGSYILDRELYVINHAYDKGGERIDVFDIITTSSDIPKRLVFKHSITSEWMKKEFNGILNSLVVVEPNKFYVTQYKGEPDSFVDDQMVSHETKALIEFLKARFLGTRNCHIWYCEYNSDEVNCRKVASHFTSANGLTHNKDYSKIFIADQKDIVIFDRDASTNDLSGRIELKAPHFIDNVKYDQTTEKVYGGTINNLMSVLKHKFPEESDELISGAVEISQNNDGKWEAKEVLSTSKLHCVSNGLRMHNHLVLGAGGIGYEGILVCPVVSDDNK